MSHCSSEEKAISRLAADWTTGAILYLTKVVRVGGTHSCNGQVRRVNKMVFIKHEETLWETKCGFESNIKVDIKDVTCGG
jgi:hypothetical protein